jgi:all-trans-8'-apo-beta-carotenal 15,15'-oxygenase
MQAAPSPTVRPDMKSIAREHGWLPLRVEGSLPSELTGTLVRTGPGLYETFGVRVGHSFEADGAMVGVRLSNGRAEGAVKVIESEGLRAERRAGKPLFGRRAHPLRQVVNGFTRRSKNTGNTAMMAWQHRLFAMVESSKPMEIAPRTLGTVGETDLGGAITASFSAHPHAVLARKSILNFGFEYGPRPKIVLYELPFDGPAKNLGAVPVAENMMLHDFAVTPRHAIFFMGPARLRIFRALFGVGNFGELFTWEPERGTEIVVVPLDRPSDAVRWTVPAFWQWHFAGAWENDAGAITTHYVRYPDFDTFEELRGVGVATPGALHRAVIDPRARTMKTELVCEGAAEFPEIDPRREGETYRFVFGTSDAGDGQGRGLSITDVTTGKRRVHALAEHERTSEVIFVPRSPSAPEGDGYGLALFYDTRADTSHLAVLDTRSWEGAPVARCHFETHVPMTFHGVFF